MTSRQGTRVDEGIGTLEQGKNDKNYTIIAKTFSTNMSKQTNDHRKALKQITRNNME